MTKQITLEEALTLVSFEHVTGCGWKVGAVFGNVGGSVFGSVRGAVFGNVSYDVGGTVRGTINGREWTFVETPEEKLQQLITELGSQELLKLINQMEDN